MSTAVRTFIVHLRLPFQLALAPFFLLGAVLSGALPTLASAAAFVLVHVGLYGGATVYNSYYDQDDGPIGMLRHPPKVARPLRDAALVLQALTVAALAALAPAAGGIGAALLVMGVAYSHPRVRLKGRTFAGLALVACGQGAAVVVLGAVSLRAPPVPTLIWGAAAAAAVLVAGLYPLSSVYQIDEDARRGDLTLPVRIGWRATLGVSGVLCGGGLAAMGFVLRASLPSWWLAATCGVVLALGVFLLQWGRRFEALGPYGNHDRAMMLNIGVSAPLCGLMIYALALRCWGI